MKKFFRIIIAIFAVSAATLLLTTFAGAPGGLGEQPYVAEPVHIIIEDADVPQSPPSAVEAVPLAEDAANDDESETEPEFEPEPVHLEIPDYGFSTARAMSPESFIDNDGVFPYNPQSFELFYILDLPFPIDLADRPMLNLMGDYDIITPGWSDNNEYILFTVNERPFDGSAWFSFHVMFDFGNGQTISRGGSITIKDDSTRLVWNHDGDTYSFNESFSSIEHFIDDSNRNLTFKHLLIINEGESAGTRLASNRFTSDDWPYFVPAPGSGVASNAVVIRPVTSVEIHRDGLSRGMWAISINGWAVGEIQVTLNGEVYSMPVSFAPPDVGFSRNPTFTDLSDIISTFTFDPDSGTNTFYYVLPTALNTRGLHRDNIEVLTREDDNVDIDFISASWGRNNRSVRFTVNEMPQSPVSIAFGLTNNALGQIYGNIYHSSAWLEIVHG